MKKVKLFTGSAIAALMMIAFNSNAASDSMAHWRFDEGTGNEITDSTGNNASISLKNAKWSEGVHNGCLSIKEVLNAGHDDSQNTDSAITVQAWIKPWSPRFSDTPYILSKEGAYELKIGKNKSLSFALWLNGKKVTFESKPLVWTKHGKWTHLAATFDGSNVCVYANGALSETIAVKGKKSISSSKSDLFIGSMNGKNKLSGSIDEVIIDSKALSSHDIAMASHNGLFNRARRDNRFTDFYEKIQKRSATERIPGTLWIDTEDFDNYGGWWMDTQFVPQMGSPYLLAAGLGKAVEDASTSVTISKAGTYRLWVRNKNWIADGHTPGTFAVSVNGEKSGTTFGTAEQRAWIWQDGGTFELKKGPSKLELQDISGYYGRCDAMILTKDLKFVPKQEQKDYLAERAKFVGTVPVKEMGHFDFIVVGAGVAGINAAISAARSGIKTALIQDRPMVGGNNSAEMGVPVSGGSSIRKGRETGLNEEIGRLHAFNRLSKWATAADEVIAKEQNLTLFLNSHVFKAEMNGNTIKAVKAFNMIDGHHTRYTADTFADCTGDGWLGYYAGAEYTLGRESKEKYGEKHAKDIADNITMSGSLMQNSILGYKAIDTGKPVTFDAPAWLYDLEDNTEAYKTRPRYKDRYKSGTWWTENHGRNDDLWDPEFARDDLLRVSMSFYEWVKNHSDFAEKAKNFELSYIPVTNAKRETRRLIGDIVVVEQDLTSTRLFEDRISYFVWKLDVHHPLGIFSNESPYDYETNIKPSSMPLRILYSKNISNMFMAGRNVSVSHVALGSARVQGTTGQMGQVIGTAAAFCKKYNTTPRGIYKSHIKELQQRLLKDDVYIPEVANDDSKDLAQSADASASSQKSLKDSAFNAINGFIRPVCDDGELWLDRANPNMWISNPKQAMPQWLELNLGEKETVNSVYLTFDTNLQPKRYITWKQKLEERMPPECVRDYKVQVETASGWKTVADIKNNFERRRIHRFPAVKTSKMRVLVTATNGDKSARIFEIRAYNE